VVHRSWFGDLQVRRMVGATGREAVLPSQIAERFGI
jgi:hypothetical protein